MFSFLRMPTQNDNQKPSLQDISDISDMCTTADTNYQSDPLFLSRSPATLSGLSDDIYMMNTNAGMNINSGHLGLNGKILDEDGVISGSECSTIASDFSDSSKSKGSESGMITNDNETPKSIFNDALHQHVLVSESIGGLDAELGSNSDFEINWPLRLEQAIASGSVDELHNLVEDTCGLPTLAGIRRAANKALMQLGSGVTAGLGGSQSNSGPISGSATGVGPVSMDAGELMHDTQRSFPLSSMQQQMPAESLTHLLPLSRHASYPLENTLQHDFEFALRRLDANRSAPLSALSSDESMTMSGIARSLSGTESVSSVSGLSTPLSTPSHRRADPIFVMDLLPGVVGWVIGRAGARIKEIQQQCNCKMWVDQDVPDDQPRKLYFQGSKQSIDVAVSRVNGLLADAPLLGGKHGSISRIACNVTECPADLVGLLIGKKGWTIKKIQAESGAQIAINQSVREGLPRKIIVSGDDRSVRLALQLIDDVLRTKAEHGEFAHTVGAGVVESVRNQLAANLRAVDMQQHQNFCDDLRVHSEPIFMEGYNGSRQNMSSNANVSMYYQGSGSMDSIGMAADGSTIFNSMSDADSIDFNNRSRSTSLAAGQSEPVLSGGLSLESFNRFPGDERLGGTGAIPMPQMQQSYGSQQQQQHAMEAQDIASSPKVFGFSTSAPPTPSQQSLRYGPQTRINRGNVPSFGAVDDSFTVKSGNVSVNSNGNQDWKIASSAVPNGISSNQQALWNVQPKAPSLNGMNSQQSMAQQQQQQNQFVVSSASYEQLTNSPVSSHSRTMQSSGMGMGLPRSHSTEQQAFSVASLSNGSLSGSYDEQLANAFRVQSDFPNGGLGLGLDPGVGTARGFAQSAGNSAMKDVYGNMQGVGIGGAMGRPTASLQNGPGANMGVGIGPNANAAPYYPQMAQLGNVSRTFRSGSDSVLVGGSGAGRVGVGAAPAGLAQGPMGASGGSGTFRVNGFSSSSGYPSQQQYYDQHQQEQLLRSTASVGAEDQAATIQRLQMQLHQMQLQSAMSNGRMSPTQSLGNGIGMRSNGLLSSQSQGDIAGQYLQQQQQSISKQQQLMQMQQHEQFHDLDNGPVSFMHGSNMGMSVGSTPSTQNPIMLPQHQLSDGRDGLWGGSFMSQSF